VGVLRRSRRVVDINCLDDGRAIQPSANKSLEKGQPRFDLFTWSSRLRHYKPVMGRERLALKQLLDLIESFRILDGRKVS
jgi:hypothetical protein